MRVAVVGAGAAGLAAAWRLANAGVAVTQFERAPVVGGRARSDELEGCVVDVGAQLFGSGFTTLFRLASEVGAGDLLVRSPGRDALYRNGRAHPIAYGSVTSMITSSALPAALKFRLATRYVPYLLKHADRLNASDLLSAGGDRLDGESVADWGERELGADFVELLAYPLLGAYYGSPPERTSAVLYHALARAGLDVSVYAVSGGTGALMRAFANAVISRGGIIRHAAVRQVETHSRGVTVHSEGGPLEFDGVVLAVPAPELSPIINLPAAVSAWLQGVEYAPSAVLAVALKRAVGAEFFGLSVARTEPEVNDLVAVCVVERKTAGLVPGDRGLLLCLGAPAVNAELIARPEAAVERMLNALERILPGTRSAIARVKLYRHRTGYPAFYPGYLKHLRALPARALPKGVQLAGDYLVAPTVEGALRSGERAAHALLNQDRESA
jgi:protoporphyrinogen/coproporphyrinogen III oxidase